MDIATAPFPITVRPGLEVTSSRKRTQPIQVLVIHHSATKTPEKTYAAFISRTKAGDPVSTHFEVDLDGNVWLYMDPDKRVAYHAGPWNGRSIGIDLTGPNKARGGFTPAQVEALERLIRWLADEYNIPMNVAQWGYDASLDPKTFSGIVAHANVSAVKPDPSYTASTKDGALWADLRNRLVAPATQVPA